MNDTDKGVRIQNHETVTNPSNLKPAAMIVKRNPINTTV